MGGESWKEGEQKRMSERFRMKITRAFYPCFPSFSTHLQTIYFPSLVPSSKAHTHSQHNTCLSLHGINEHRVPVRHRSQSVLRASVSHQYRVNKPFRNQMEVHSHRIEDYSFQLYFPQALKASEGADDVVKCDSLERIFLHSDALCVVLWRSFITRGNKVGFIRAASEIRFIQIRLD